jgi:hypothetical protein
MVYPIFDPMPLLRAVGNSIIHVIPRLNADLIATATLSAIPEATNVEFSPNFIVLAAWMLTLVLPVALVFVGPTHHEIRTRLAVEEELRNIVRTNIMPILLSLFSRVIHPTLLVYTPETDIYQQIVTIVYAPADQLVPYNKQPALSEDEVFKIALDMFDRFCGILLQHAEEEEEEDSKVTTKVPLPMVIFLQDVLRASEKELKFTATFQHELHDVSNKLTDKLMNNHDLMTTGIDHINKQVETELMDLKYLTRPKEDTLELCDYQEPLSYLPNDAVTCKQTDCNLRTKIDTTPKPFWVYSCPFHHREVKSMNHIKIESDTMLEGKEGKKMYFNHVIA